MAYAWRSLMFRTTFIAVCGSVGKTTAKELLAAVLAQSGPVSKTRGSAGSLRFGGVAKTILAVRPWHRFAIVEAGIESEGQMAKLARLLRPDMVVMLAVKEGHMKEFKTLDNVAAEKAEMVRALGSAGVAVLNRDDPRVAAMAEACDGRVVWFGASGQGISITDASSRWPDRLRLTIREGDRAYPVETRLVGEHWTVAVLAAVTTARQCGLEMQQCLVALEQVEPFWSRLQPITLENGVTYLRDDFNGYYDTFTEALRVMRDAGASRRITVASEYTDSHGKVRPRQRVQRLAREVAPVTDVAIFVGERADAARRAALSAGMEPDTVHAARNVREASDLLKRLQRPGDLVLIKGRGTHHMSRIYLDQLDTVTCTEDSCPRQHVCDRCELLGFSWEEKYRGLMAPMDMKGL
jgi:UDP-N-acetylmuramoyl-tripeptide--D-alanyl-D-alanine ligase